MYDSLITLKSEASFTIDELHRVALDVVKTGSASIERQGDLVSINAAGGGQLHIGWSDAAHVVEESDEIAERYVPSQGCRGRFEMAGDDPDMELFNEYLIINESLQETGKFVIFDTLQCKLFEELG